MAHGRRPRRPGSPHPAAAARLHRALAELERELGADFEIKRTGGLMVAETERDLAFLAAKTEVEHSNWPGRGTDYVLLADPGGNIAKSATLTIGNPAQSGSSGAATAPA